MLSKVAGPIQIGHLSKKINGDKHLQAVLGNPKVQNSMMITGMNSELGEKAQTRYVRKLGAHHFAHLRAIAEGLDLQESARRYLGIEHGHQTKNAHQQTVDSVRAIARRRGESAWRLIGLTIKVKAESKKLSLEEYMTQRGDLDGWREEEVLEMYLEAYPTDQKADRRHRLRERQIELIRTLEGLAAEKPLGSDLVSGWFDDVTARKLISAGMTTLSELNQRVSAGGKWYSTLPSIGQAKAIRIAALLRTLLPQEAVLKKPTFALSTDQVQHESVQTSALQPIHTALPSPSASLLRARTDIEAVEEWISSRAGSQATVKSYRREAKRLLLWLQYEAGGKTLAQMKVADCGDYMAFLQNIPPRWISRDHAKPEESGWAPFRGPLSHQSYRQAIIIIAAMFTWLQSAEYLTANPWVLLNKKTGDDPEKKILDTKALSETATSEVLRFIESQPPSPTRERFRFILRFVEAVGLRSAELLSARLYDLRLEPEGWMLQIHGKGSKNRVAAIPGQAFEALQHYLKARGLGGIETAPPGAPLLASAKDPMKPIGYQALYEHVNKWLTRAITASDLPAHERLKLVGASTHWLRHTFGTRAIAREVPIDVIQAQMGHSSTKTITSTYGRAPLKRQVDELGKAFS